MTSEELAERFKAAIPADLPIEVEPIIQTKGEEIDGQRIPAGELPAVYTAMKIWSKDRTANHKYARIMRVSIEEEDMDALDMAITQLIEHYRMLQDATV